MAVVTGCLCKVLVYDKRKREGQCIKAVYIHWFEKYMCMKTFMYACISVKLLVVSSY